MRRAGWMRGLVLAVAAAAAYTALPAAPAGAQSLGSMVGGRGKKTEADSTALRPRPPVPWQAAVGEVALGTVLAAAGGYGIGLLAQSFCSNCSASKPGGDTPGILVGLPVGAFIGVTMVGRTAPPPGRLSDTAIGVLSGTAVFAGFSRVLEGQSDLIRWSGVILPAAVGAMSWNRSRPPLPPAVSFNVPAPSRWGRAAPSAELALVSFGF